MKQLTPRIIAEVTEGEYIGDLSAQNIRVMGVARDNRDVTPCNLFICIRGKNVDGHSFANSAFSSGAACCLAEQLIPGANGPYIIVKSTLQAAKALGAYYRSLFDIPIIGVTGSVGKTCAKELIAAALGSKLNVLKTQGNLNNELGVPLTLLSLTERHEAAVVEMGINDFGEMSRLAEMVRPDIFVVTKIGYSHLEKLGDLDGVLRAKGEAFSYIKTDGVAILNGDDELLWGCDPGVRKMTFGLGVRNDFRVEKIHAEGTSAVLCDIASAYGRFTARIPAYGVHLARMSAAAAAVGYLLGVRSDDISKGLLSYAPVGGRANVADTGFITLIDDCYNANPDSVESALTSLAALPNRKVAILGDMFELGAHSDKLHQNVGIFAARTGIDSLICCGDKAKSIFEGYGSANGKAARYFRDKAELIVALPNLIEKSDAVLVKASRGMKFEEITGFLATSTGPQPA
ncbi:MAG: UDP-N-acetylmuramoyl-tripeptide--D-alanyl-D-alanine ligase [Oscillospiraceae bacterium]|nr:UDP-N-acetylmuramoyl-tripeptide--D-alanyl-D-alanine ligase [Oscillospiraceae bacterium]